MQSRLPKVIVARPRPEAKTRTSGSERFRNIALGIAGVISSVLIPLIGLYYTSRDKEREVSKGFVEIATKILSDKPTDENKPLREWAIALIDNYSAVRLSDDARNALLNKQPIFEAPGVIGGISKIKLQELQTSGLTLGVTISHHKSTVDFPMLKEHGVKFAFIKASQGSSFVDPKAIEYASEARKTGIAVGLYHFFLPDADVQMQFKNFADRLTAIPWELPPTIDCEEFPGASIPSDYAARVKLFADALQQRFGVKPVIYAGSSFATQHLDERESQYPLFIAQFGGRATPTVPKWWKDYLFWHLAEGVNDDPLLRGYDIVAFKGQSADLAALGRK